MVNPMKIASTRLIRLGLTVLALGSAMPALADQALQLGVTDKGFDPTELTGPAGQRMKIEVTNRTSAAIEFESFELNRERVIQPGQTVSVYVSGLAAGRYEFFDDFNTARRGVLVLQ